MAPQNSVVEDVQFAAPAGSRAFPINAPYLARLNVQQRRAVEHEPDGPLLIIAGAGSGKTNTLAHRVAHLIASGADPRRIMLLTFSRRAAAEMERRVQRITAQKPLHSQAHSPGQERFTRLARGCCGSTPRISGLTPNSQYMIAKTQPIS